MKKTKIESTALTTIDVEATEIVSRQWKPYAPPFNAAQAESALVALHEGITLREHCRMMKQEDSTYPTPAVIYAWVTANSGGDFANQYAVARRAQAHHWAEEIITIAEDGSNDFIERRRLNGDIIRTVDNEAVQRSKLRVDTRKWLLARLHPDVYADRVQHQQLGANGMPVDPPSNVSPIDLSIALKAWKPKE